MAQEHSEFLDYIIEQSLKKRNEREIIIWGRGVDGKLLGKKLKEKYDIKVKFIVDSNSKLWDGSYVFSPDILAGKSDEYYVIISIGYYASIKEAMSKYGYEKDNDYYYFSDCIIEQREDYYEDFHGNMVIGNHCGLTYEFRGQNSTIEIGEKVEFSNVRIVCRNNAYVKIGNNSSIRNAKLTVFNHGRLVTGEYFTNSGIYSSGTMGLNMEIFPYSSIIIGNDCMFAYNITMWTSDGHPIFDVKTRKNITSTKEIAEKRKIVIGDHVWIGMNTFILYNTDVGNGSVIGANSLVKGKIPNNCVAAGSPARVIRRDIAWARYTYSEDINDCGEEYINLTEDII